MIKDMDADIICFSETHLKEEDNFPIINRYSGRHTMGKKSLKTGRNIKGVSVYIKDNLDNLEFKNVVNEKGTLIITKITSKKYEYLRDIYLIACYRSNRESKYKDKDFYQNIKNHILDHKMENIIILGDLNGRIGTENDNKKYGLPKRKSEDKTINNYGHDIITFCNETNLIIANGRFENSDCLGKCTFHCIQNGVVKKSMIDYLIISESILTLLNEFEIGNPVLYTDHSQIKIKLKSTRNRGYRIQRFKISEYFLTNGRKKTV